MSFSFALIASNKVYSPYSMGDLSAQFFCPPCLPIGIGMLEACLSGEEDDDKRFSVLFLESGTLLFVYGPSMQQRLRYDANSMDGIAGFIGVDEVSMSFQLDVYEDRRRTLNFLEHEDEEHRNVHSSTVLGSRDQAEDGLEYCLAAIRKIAGVDLFQLPPDRQVHHYSLTEDKLLKSQVSPAVLEWRNRWSTSADKK